MSLDPTAREANVRDSIKKHFVDNIALAEGIALTFDTSLATPPLSQGGTVDKWVVVNIGEMERSRLSSLLLEVTCATRKDNEGFKLAQLTDTVIENMSDNTQTDGLKRITFYRSRATGVWTQIGSLLVTGMEESPQMDGPDKTKYKIITFIIKWVSNI